MPDIDGKMTLLYSYLPKRLANRLQIDFEPGDTLNAVACSLMHLTRFIMVVWKKLGAGIFPESTSDLPVALGDLDRATVFHLFGKLTVIPEYAATDEDILEFMHTLQSRSRPPRLFQALNKQYLLVIGCPFPDWLGHRLRLSQQRSPMITQ
jgi:hypothetical protein